MLNYKIIQYVICMILICSCSSLRKMTVDSFAPLFYQASVSFEDEDNWENFKLSVLGNLKLGEGFLSITPENEHLLGSLTKGYAGYAFIVNESQYLDDYLKDSLETFNQEQAIRNYTKAFKYGLRYLQQKGISYKDLIGNISNSDQFNKLLELGLSVSDQDLEVVLFTSHALSGLVNLQKEKPALIAQLPVAKMMFDWVCSKKPDINFGTCDIFYGIYESGRPRSLGGNPSKGKKYFLDGIKKYPNNWLIRVAYIQYYLIPMGEEEEYKEQKKFLSQAQVTFKKSMSLSWSYNASDEEELFKFDKGNRLKIYQATSLKRYEIIEKYEEEIF